MLNHTNENISKLKAWYEEKVKAQRIATKRIRNNLVIVLFINLLLALFLFGLATAHPNENDEERNNIIGVIFLSLIIPGVGFWILQSSKADLDIEIDEIINQCPKISQSEYADLYETCNDILRNMDLKIDFQIHYVKNNNYFPGILEKDSKVYLLVPRNFITLYYKSRGMALSILYHEFAHIVQRDSNNYLLNGILTKKVFHFGLVFVPLTLIVWISTGNIGVSMVTIVGFSSFIGLGNLRLQSEELADASVLIYDDGRNLITALEQYAIKDTGGRATHHAPTLRIKFLKAKIEYFKLYYDETSLSKGNILVKEQEQIKIKSTEELEKEKIRKIEDEKYNKQIRKIATFVLVILGLFTIFRVLQLLSK